MTTSPSPIRNLLRPYRRLFSVIAAAAVLTSVLEGLTVAAFFPLLAALSGNAGPAPARWFPVHSVAALAGLLFALVVFKSAAVLLRDWRVARGSGSIQHSLKERLMKQYARSSFQFFLDSKQGQLLYNLSTACTRVGVLSQKIPQMFSEALKVAAIGLLLFLSAPWATLLLMGIGFGYHRLTHALSGRVSYHTGKGRVVAAAEQSSIASEFLTGIRQILAFGTQPDWLGRFSTQSRKYSDLTVQDAVWLSVPKVLLEVSAIGFLLGALWIFRGESPAGIGSELPMLGMFSVGLLRILPSLTLLGQLRMEITGLLGDAELLDQAFHQEPVPPPAGRPIFGGLRSGISFEKVGFSYPQRAPLFENLSLEFPKGSVTALVGPSGSGKTTLAYLLMGLLQPTAGRILVDGRELAQWDPAGWRAKVGFVSQEIFIFHGSVEENIAFGRNGFAPRQIEQAARIARADEFIARLPDGYKTLVGEKGMKLSGGQQQRLAIARAVLHEPEILLFDEATSFLDTESEQRVQEAVEKVSEGRTVILIAHRLSTVRRADRIVVLEQGKVAEQGSHAQLLQERGRYFQMITAGAGSSELAR